MSENAAKLSKLRKEIEGCCEKEAAEIVEAVQKAAEEALAAAEKKIRGQHKDNTRKTVEKFRNEQRKRVSEVRFSENRRVLIHRGKLTDEFFARVEAEIKEETAKPVYKDYLLRCVTETEEKYSLSGAEIYCREADIEAVKAVASEKGAQILCSDSITLGGIVVKIPDKNIIMDLSLDAALESERESFSASKEMQL